MAKTVEAVYENGVFKPLQPVELPEGQRVQVALPDPAPRRPPTPEEVEEIMRLGREVYEGLTDQEIADIEACFSKREPEPGRDGKEKPS